MIEVPVRDIAEVAYAAERASKEAIAGAPQGDPWESLTAARQAYEIDRVMAIWRGLDEPGVFVATVKAILALHDGHGGLALDQLGLLGQFMVDEMDFNPAEHPGVTIAGSAILALRDLKEEARKQPLGLLDAARNPTVTVVQDEDYYRRIRALELANRPDSAAGEIVETARVFHAFLAAVPAAAE